MSSKTINFGLKTSRRVLKLDAKAGCLKMRNGGGDDVTCSSARMEMDLAGLRVGWIQFRTGEGVVMQGTASDPSPGEDWQMGIQLDVDGTDDAPELGGPIGEAEICSTSYVVRGAIADLYTKQYLPAVDDHPGEIPIVDISDWSTVRMKNGTAYKPQMRIVGWSGNDEEAVEIDGPSELLT